MVANNTSPDSPVVKTGGGELANLHSVYLQVAAGDQVRHLFRVRHLAKKACFRYGGQLNLKITNDLPPQPPQVLDLGSSSRSRGTTRSFVSDRQLSGRFGVWSCGMVLNRLGLGCERPPDFDSIFADYQFMLLMVPTGKRLRGTQTPGNSHGIREVRGAWYFLPLQESANPCGARDSLRGQYESTKSAGMDCA